MVFTKELNSVICSEVGGKEKKGEDIKGIWLVRIS